MTLKQTVSEIKGYEVTEGQARLFASEQYGVLATYIRNKLLENLKIPK